MRLPFDGKYILIATSLFLRRSSATQTFEEAPDPSNLLRVYLLLRILRPVDLDVRSSRPAELISAREPWRKCFRQFFNFMRSQIRMGRDQTALTGPSDRADSVEAMRISLAIRTVAAARLVCSTPSH